jgi:hypothetical protein
VDCTAALGGIGRAPPEVSSGKVHGGASGVGGDQQEGCG